MSAFTLLLTAAPRLLDYSRSQCQNYRWSTASRPFHLGVRYPCGTQDQIFMTLRQVWFCDLGRLHGERTVCSLRLLLDYAKAVNLGADYRRIHDHALLHQIWVSPNLEGKVASVYSPERGWFSYTPYPRHWAPFRRPLRVAGPRLGYSNRLKMEAYYRKI
jgi:hypothetical protein